MHDPARQEAILKAEARIKAKEGQVGASELPAQVEPEPKTPDPIPVVDAQAPAADAAPPQEEEIQDDSAPSTDDPAAPHPKNKGVGKRINELTREKHEERRAREQAEAENKYLKEQLQAQAKPAEPVQQAPKGEPTLEQFGWDQAKYLDARAEWLVNQRFAQRELEQRRQQEQASQQERQLKFQERLKAFEEANPGVWDEVVKAPITTTEPMLAVIAQSDVGPQIGAYLKDHLDEAQAISRMPAYLAAAALGRIEGKLTSKPPQASAPQNTTRAPPPPATVTSGSAATKPVTAWDFKDHQRYVREQRIAKNSS